MGRNSTKLQREVEHPKMATPLLRLRFGVRRCLRRFSMLPG